MNQLITRNEMSAICRMSDTFLYTQEKKDPTFPRHSIGAGGTFYYSKDAFLTWYKANEKKCNPHKRTLSKTRSSKVLPDFICGLDELAKYIGCPEKVAKVTSQVDDFPAQKSVWIRKEVEAWLANN